MLALVGMGLAPKDISVSALEFLKSSDIILLESYTSLFPKESSDFISSYTGRHPERTKRSDFEDDLVHTVARARESTMAILVVGDPLIATTHHIILDEAAKQGVATRVFHSSSIFSAAIGESGLDIYKFGPTTTIPFWSANYRPTSFVDVIRRNLSNSQHTLVLLDIDQARARPMDISTAMGVFHKAGGESAVPDDSEVLVLANVGRDDQRIIYSRLGSLERLGESLDGKALSIIVPAKPSFAELESLKRFST